MEPEPRRNRAVAMAVAMGCLGCEWGLVLCFKALEGFVVNVSVDGTSALFLKHSVCRRSFFSGKVCSDGAPQYLIRGSILAIVCVDLK